MATCCTLELAAEQFVRHLMRLRKVTARGHRP